MISILVDRMVRGAKKPIGKDNAFEEGKIKNFSWMILPSAKLINRTIIKKNKEPKIVVAADEALIIIKVL